MTKYYIINLYHFKTIDNTLSIKIKFLKIMYDNNIKGTIILSNEGINASLTGKKEKVLYIIEIIVKTLNIQNIKYKISCHNKMPFKKAKVKIKQEIVALGRYVNINNINIKNTYISPENWNEIILKSNMLIIDVRNNYEIKIGKFKNAINPKIKTFREFPKYVKEKLNTKKHKKIAMYCTGGIRCEKSTAYLKSIGFNEVYQLQGGIINYFQKIKKYNSLWNGECFVFDERVSINQKLIKGKYEQCYACKNAITNEDQYKIEYIKGIQCHNCYGKHNIKQIQKFKERQKQYLLSISRNEKI